jgi:hypothetical protein
LPNDLFSMPGEIRPIQSDMETDGKGEIVGEVQKRNRAEWGPTLLGKRPSKHQQDGRTIMEKAQERKMISNLETNKGKARLCNKFSVLSSDEICQVAGVVGINLGDNSEEIDRSVSYIIELDKGRGARFDSNCTQCSCVDETRDMQRLEVGNNRDGTLLTPTN